MRLHIPFLTVIAAGIAVMSCGSGSDDHKNSRLVEKARLSEMLRPDPVRENPYDSHLDSMPGGGRRMHINYLGATLGATFNDSNYIHYEAARKIGIDPITSVTDVCQLRRPLVRIESCADFFVDELTYSLPYLVPEAAELLHSIGRGFRDSLAARGGGDYRVKVTSILRTPLTIKALRRRNRNAVDSSTHLFATTFDISYAKFICDNDSMPRTQEDLKNLLGEVLYRLRNDGRCYVKYERKQACFHITTRK